MESIKFEPTEIQVIGMEILDAAKGTEWHKELLDSYDNNEDVLLQHLEDMFYFEELYDENGNIVEDNYSISREDKENWVDTILPDEVMLGTLGD